MLMIRLRCEWSGFPLKEKEWKRKIVRDANGRYEVVNDEKWYNVFQFCVLGITKKYIRHIFLYGHKLKKIMNKNMRCNLTIKKGDKRTPHWGAILPYVCITIHQTSILTKDCRLRLKRCIVRVLYSCAIILLEKHKLMHVSTTHHLFWYSSISHFFSFPQHQS